jgi:hypothetical protein
MSITPVESSADASIQSADATSVAGTEAHLSLWNAVMVTDPKYSRAFTRTGGFSGTAINATYQVRKATEQFGPIGLGWGYTVLEERFQNGASLGFDSQGSSLGTEIIHIVRIELWYRWGGNTGKLQHFGQTTFVGKTRNGVFTDEEAPKKSLTDAISKCLSLLGFGADVFMGLYDDQKYVDALHDHFTDQQINTVTVTAAGAAHPGAGQTLSDRYKSYMNRIQSGELKGSPQLHALINSDISLSPMERTTLIAALPLSLTNNSTQNQKNDGNPVESIFI